MEEAARELEKLQEQYFRDFGHLDKVAQGVLYSSQNHFVRLFAQAWLEAAADNQMLLRPVWVFLIDKYGLEAELTREGPS